MQAELGVIVIYIIANYPKSQAQVETHYVSIYLPTKLGPS